VTFVIDPTCTGVAFTSGGTTTFCSQYFKNNPLDTDVTTHEVMHIVQSYTSPAVPGWLTEGIADYVRDTFGINNAVAGWTLPAFSTSQKYTDAYRVTARFLLWLELRFCTNIVEKLDAAARSGTYSANTWVSLTGSTVDQLWSLYSASPAFPAQPAACSTVREQWGQDPALRPAGCATSIAVAQGNTPWVTGCEPSADRNVYYLGRGQGPCGGGLCSDTWVNEPGLKANQVVVSAAGQLAGIASNGTVWLGVGTPTFSPNAWESFLAAGGCLTSLSVERPTLVPNAIQRLWGIGCGGAGDKGIFVLPLQSSGPWQQLPGAAVQTALFRSIAPTGAFVETPWVLTAEGTVYAYNAGTNNWIQQPGWNVTSLTDHYAVGAGGSVYQWDDSAPDFLSGQFVHGNWSLAGSAGTPILPATPSAPIREITYAGGWGPTGSSQLWAIDTSGNIYFAMPVSRPPG
jgi:hypothetical protein